MAVSIQRRQTDEARKVRKPPRRHQDFDKRRRGALVSILWRRWLTFAVVMATMLDVARRLANYPPFEFMQIAETTE